MRLVYIIITAASAVFYIMYKGDISFVLLVFLLVLPAALFAALTVCSAFLKITVRCDDPVTEKEKGTAVRINIRNRSFLPVSSCEIKVKYSASAPFEAETPAVRTTAVPLGGRAGETVSLSFVPEHCGTFSVRVEHARLNDLMGLTFLKKRIGFSVRIVVLPRIFPIAAAMESSFVYSAESNLFSKEKPGDDPSEIFMLREYRSGDRHNLIHWKLSSRSEDFIVKELSKPVGSRILILADPGGCGSADGADRILEAAASVSAFLAESGTVHTLAFPAADYTLRVWEIDGIDSLYSAAAAVSREIRSLEFERSAAYVMQLSDGGFIVNGGFSRVIAVTERCGEAYAGELAALCGEARLTVICTSPSPDEDGDKPAASAEFIFADAEKLSSGKGELFQ